MKKAVVFDFDGTIADTFLMAVDIFHSITKRTEPLAKGEITRLRGLALLEVARELGVPYWKIPYLAMKGRKMLGTQMARVEAFPGMLELVRELHDAGHALYIVSSNSRVNIEQFIDKYRLQGLFTDIVGNARLGGKARLLKRLCRRGEFDASSVYYIGDEDRDIEAAHHAGVHALAVAWGYNNQVALKRHNPEIIIFEPTEIKEFIEADEAIAD